MLATLFKTADVDGAEEDDAPRRRPVCPPATSEAASLLIVTSPPPDTVAVLVKLAGGLLATFTVRVSVWKLAPLASTSGRVAVMVWPFTAMVQPLTVSGPAYVSPVGSMSRTITGPVVADPPA